MAGGGTARLLPPRGRGGLRDRPRGLGDPGFVTCGRGDGATRAAAVAPGGSLGGKFTSNEKNSSCQVKWKNDQYPKASWVQTH